MTSAKRTDRKKGIFTRSAMLALVGVGALLTGPSTYAPYIPYEDNPLDPPEVKALKADFARTAVGREALMYAHAKGVNVVIDDKLSGGYRGLYKSGEKLIALKTGMSFESQRVYLGHELRHVWQDKELGYGTLENKFLTPEQRWTLRRFIEADARAFSIYYQANRIWLLREAPSSPGAEADFEMKAAANLSRKMGWDGLSLRDYREIALGPSFSVLLKYNESHLGLALKGAQKYVDEVQIAQQKLDKGDKRGARKILRKVEKDFARKMPEEDFTAELRRFGGVSLDHRTPTALNFFEVGEKTLRRDFARAAVGNSDAIARIDAALQDIAVRQKALEHYVEYFNATDDGSDDMPPPYIPMPTLPEIDPGMGL